MCEATVIWQHQCKQYKGRQLYGKDKGQMLCVRPPLHGSTGNVNKHFQPCFLILVVCADLMMLHTEVTLRSLL